MLKRYVLLPVAWLGLSLSAQSAVLVDFGSTWRYFIGTQEASSPDTNAWRAIGFDDSGWTNGPAPIGYANPPNDPGGYEATIRTPLPSSSASNYTSVYFRKKFMVSN